MGSRLAFSGIITKQLSAIRTWFNPNYQQIASIKLLTKEQLENIKIPIRPKRPLTPYLKFLIEHRPEVKKQNPSLSTSQILSKCAEDWQKIDEDKKKSLTSAYAKDLSFFAREVERYKSSLTEEQLEALKQIKKDKQEKKEKRKLHVQWREEGKPKRPITSFIMFIQEKSKLPENKNQKLIVTIQKYKEEYKSLSSEQMQEYKEKAEINLKKYREDMIAWEAKMVKEGKNDIIRKDSKVLTNLVKKSKS